jgi:hypothetical protein
MRKDFLDEELFRYKVATTHYTVLQGKKKNIFDPNEIRIKDTSVHHEYDCSHNKLQDMRQWPVILAATC